MKQKHVTFDRANEQTARRVVDAALAQPGVTVKSLDEVNPGSAHQFRIKTNLGTICVTPGHVLVPHAFADIVGMESSLSPKNNGRYYMLPNHGSRSGGRVAGLPGKFCPECRIQMPVTGVCGYCS